jgi:hypothetical protein
MNRGTVIHVPRRFVAHEWGGTETVILEISKQQLAAGYEPKIVTSMALATSRHDVIGGIAVERYPHIYPFCGLSAEDRAAMDKKGGNLLSLPLLAALLREPDVRIYHAHALKRLGGSGFSPRRGFRCAGRRTGRSNKTDPGEIRVGQTVRCFAWRTAGAR